MRSYFLYFCEMQVEVQFWCIADNIFVENKKRLRFKHYVDLVEGQHVRKWKGGAVAQSVEHATPGEEIVGSIPAAAAAPYCLGRCQYNVIG